ncbi:plasmid SOS inhibition protein A [Cronobacter sakazakii]|nr:plasmid SOS inhibition protein A [Cronobacter sakazakii]ELY5855262.1 plasmid SOS inhibition protein A [Cronobacter malonaticus]
MIPANLSLVPLSHERRAAMQAIAEVEKKYERGVHVAEFAYARAFFRTLNGSKRVTVKDIAWFSPGLTAQNLRGKKQDWLAAIDRLIESRGACCWLPLSVSDGRRLFPETKFQTSERRRRQNELSAEKYTRQRRKEAYLRDTAYRALAGQAEIELAFHTPGTVGSWSARWSGTELRQHDLEDMFWHWSERFPSLAPMERWMMANQPFWSVMVESDALAKESPEPVRQLERWMVPNKPTHRSHV